jgi:signal transduction histidine kinase
LGDLSTLVRPAVLEATVLRETERADAAARDERERLSQDLHDGLQGRLLGLALNLQLSGREVDDPAARLLVEQTVASLRDAVEDVRALAGCGRHSPTWSGRCRR